MRLSYQRDHRGAGRRGYFVTLVFGGRTTRLGRVRQPLAPPARWGTPPRWAPARAIQSPASSPRVVGGGAQSRGASVKRLGSPFRLRRLAR